MVANEARVRPSGAGEYLSEDFNEKALRESVGKKLESFFPTQIFLGQVLHSVMSDRIIGSVDRKALSDSNSVLTYGFSYGYT